MRMIYEIQQIKGFKLPVVTSDIIPLRWLFIDTETRETTHDGKTYHVFKLGWTCYIDRDHREGRGGEVWHFWKSAWDMNLYIEGIGERKKGVYFVGHNIFFDLQACGFFRYFTHSGWTLNWMYDKGITYIMRIVKNKSAMNIVSSTNWFNFSLKRLGAMVGLEKLDIDFDKSTDRQLKVYCRRDVEILVKSVDYLIDFVTSHSLGRLSFTRGAQAYTAFRRRFMTGRIVIHREESVRELERKAYFGGRTEAFRLGEITGGPFVTLDVNSMYPYVMSKFRYPVELVEYNKPRTLSNLKEIINKYGIIAWVDIEVPEPVFPVYHNKRTVFPVGKFTTYLCTEGIRYALDQGYIKKVHQTAVYKMSDIFSDWVKYFYGLKVQYGREENTPMLMLVKAMLNSLYGKFGQRKIMSDIYVNIGDDKYSRDNIINIDSGELTTITRIMNTEIVQYNQGEAPFSIPAIPAHVTENARLYLWYIINMIGRDKVLYCDTDSVKIRKSDMHLIADLIDPEGLGMLKIENESNELFIGGAKNYRTESSRHIKGIPATAVEVEPGIFEYTTFTRQVTALKHRQITGVEMLKVLRSLTGKYEKGEVLSDGQVIPYSL